MAPRDAETVALDPDRWRSTFDGWAGQNPLLASTGEPSNPEELASVGLVLGDWMDLTGTERCLDVGCASGTLTSMWANRARDVYGIDFCESLLEDAKTLHGDSIQFLHAEAASLPFPDGHFDAVCCYGVFLCLPDHDYVTRAIDEILRVAKPASRIVIGGLPDQKRRGVFFDHCDAMTSWYRRAIPRSVRWMIKRLLKPSSRPGQTAILWFDVDAIARDLRGRGFVVEIENDPEISNYAVYRKTLVITSAHDSSREEAQS